MWIFQNDAPKDTKMEKKANRVQRQMAENEPIFAFRVGEKHVHFIGESAFAEFEDVDCFEVTCRDGRIILEPLQREMPTLEEIRDKIAALGITEEDIAAEVAAVRAERARRNCQHCG